LTSSKRRSLVFGAAARLAAALLLIGCPSEPPSEVNVAEGVVFRSDKAQGIQTLTVDRQTAQVRPIVVAEKLERRHNNTVGEARTVQEWARKHGAIAGVNAGFFGDTYDSRGRRKQLVQLCVVEGKVVAPGTPVGTALRSAIGFSDSGEVELAWATGTEQSGARRYEKPVKSKTGLTWRSDYAVACGPRLIHRSKMDIADRAEKLVSDVKVSRMAVALSERYLVFCRADAMTYGELGRYLLRFYKETLHSAPTEAMCLDGGPSAQMVYQDGGSLKDREPTGVQVPTAILLVPKPIP
jgi:exopolysaccharide biosynthesis protein